MPSWFPKGVVVGAKGHLRWKPSTDPRGRSRRDVTPSPCKSPAFVKPVYQLSGFQFNKTGAGSPPADVGLTTFLLHDIVNNNSFSCTTPYLQDPDSGEWSDCYPSDDMTSPRTVFRHMFENHQVDVGQMWVCDQQNKTFPGLFFSSATLTYAHALSCDNQDGSNTHTHCVIPDTESIPFSGGYITPDWNVKTPAPIPLGPIPANATDNPPWNETPCVGLSFSYPNWDVDNFSHTTGSVSFSLRNHANNASTQCSFQRDGSDEAQWVACGNSTKVLFDGQSGLLFVNQTWECSISNYDEPYADPVMRERIILTDSTAESCSRHSET